MKDKGAILTTYKTGGHSSWIHPANNETENNGEHVWQWTAKQILTVSQIATQPSETTNSSQENTSVKSVKTGDTSKVEYYVIIGITSASLLAHYVLKKEKVLYH